ncbi:SCO6880 family protein [Microbacterium thalli]|uniref:SCO6880 family protein n=1 Tax=Microbacterium thalli TaxID=3027921 RepID=UPI002366D6D5|nr:SCO6880 family protein [Microbacterium thalli]MDD7930780.1 hypothetical protein [Microbacterium thalli]
MSTEQITPTERTRFGNWIPVRKATIGGLTVVGWGILLLGLILMVMFFTRGAFGVGLIVFGAALLFELVFVLRFGGDATGETIASRLSTALSGVRRVDRGEARFNSGLFSNLPADNLTGLPGLLGNLREVDGTDGRGDPFTLLYDPNVETVTAVFACNPEGTDLQQRAKIDQDIAWYGNVIASLSRDTAIAGAVTIVDSALRSSEPLVQKIASDIDPQAPAVARQAMMEAAQRLPERYAELSTWVTISWSVPALAGGIEDAVAEVASKLPYHVDALRDAGGGAVVTATSGMIADAVRVAYSPERSTEIASDELRGHHNALRVTEAGPDYFDDSNRRVCLHDEVASMTALVLAPPRLHITEDTLAPLFRPSERFLRKRVTTFYRPVSAAKSTALVEQMGATASTVATAKARRTERDNRVVQHAAKLEQEVTSGAAITRFGMAVTVTFEPDTRSYREATLKLKSLLEASSLTYRFCEHDAGPAFHTTLPLGILPWLYETQIEKVMGKVA